MPQSAVCVGEGFRRGGGSSISELQVRPKGAALVARQQVRVLPRRNLQQAVGRVCWGGVC